MTTPSPAPSPTSSCGFKFVLVDLTTSATPAALKPAAAFADMIAAFSEQIAGEFGAAWGDQDVTFRVASSPTDRATDENAINCRDTIPEAPDALAYHQVVGGVPDIEIGIDLFSALTTGPESVSSGIDHELLETLRDAGANGWKDRQDESGEMDAEEVCDFVQNTGYAASNGVMLSNFVRPSFFVPGSSGPWDYLGVMTSQYDVSSGYGIQAPSPSAESQIGGLRPHTPPPSMSRLPHIVGTLSETQRKRKAHRYSRASRRGVKL
jgi:hypothetical protein